MIKYIAGSCVVVLEDTDRVANLSTTKVFNTSNDIKTNQFTWYIEEKSTCIYFKGLFIEGMTSIVQTMKNLIINQSQQKMPFGTCRAFQTFMEPFFNAQSKTIFAPSDSGAIFLCLNQLFFRLLYN